MPENIYHADTPCLFVTQFLADVYQNKNISFALGFLQGAQNGGFCLSFIFDTILMQ
jgi:hypothetical protein